MSKYIPGNQKHLTLENRIYIENELNKGTPFKDIAMIDLEHSENLPFLLYLWWYLDKR